MTVNGDGIRSRYNAFLRRRYYNARLEGATHDEWLEGAKNDEEAEPMALNGLAGTAVPFFITFAGTSLKHRQEKWKQLSILVTTVTEMSSQTMSC